MEERVEIINGTRNKNEELCQRMGKERKMHNQEKQKEEYLSTWKEIKKKGIWIKLLAKSKKGIHLTMSKGAFSDLLRS